MIPKAQKVPEAINQLFSNGNVYVNKKQADHNATVATDMAEARTLFGNISERTTHVTGANDMA